MARFRTVRRAVNVRRVKARARRDGPQRRERTSVVGLESRHRTSNVVIRCSVGRARRRLLGEPVERPVRRSGAWVLSSTIVQAMAHRSSLRLRTPSRGIDKRRESRRDVPAHRP